MEIHVNKKMNLSKNELGQLSKEQLILKVLQLEAHNKQLMNLLQKTSKKCSVTRNLKSFDFSMSHKRHVLLKFLYLGWDYKGYVTQEETTETIEHHLFEALEKTCLIQKRENSNYNRCGRTDKQVSAFNQIVSIDLRSKFPENEQLKLENISGEIDYCGILNRVLPESIKCISWMPLKNKNYSARFDCTHRTYRYYFPTANLNIEAMQEGCKYLIGRNDFRNFCKMDVSNGVTSFVRNVFSASIKTCDFSKENNHKGYEIKYLEIISRAFLWHQIRCIMAILILIGQNHEEPSIIKELLDIEKNPCKPQYNLANGLPLNLYSCNFQEENLLIEDDVIFSATNEADKTTKWCYNEKNLYKLLEDLQAKWTIYCIQSTMIRDMIASIENIYSTEFIDKILPKSQVNVLLSNKQKEYKKLLSRKRCESLENRLDNYIRKKRLILASSSRSE